jgi:hypothetical protein
LESPSVALDSIACHNNGTRRFNPACVAVWPAGVL